MTYLEQKQTLCSLEEKEGERWMRNEKTRGRTDGWIERQIVVARHNYKK